MKSHLTREQIVELDKKLIWHPYTPMGPYIEEGDPLVIERAEGVYLYDKDGTRYFDANASWWVNIVGHNHPRLMEALRKQTESLAHCSLANIIHEPAVQLAEKLLPLCGKNASRLFFSDDGSTAVEAGLRMALQYWQLIGRPEKKRFVALTHSFHGETLGAAAVSATQVFHKSMGDILFDCIRLPSPGYALTDTADTPWYEEAFARAEEILREKSSEISAIIIEPLVQGAAGMLMYPPEYIKRLYDLTREMDVLLIADEVFVGYGRCGTFLAHHQANIEADIICLAKGFSGGVLPMAGTVASDRVFQAFAGGPERTLWYGHSFTGNPLGCAVALETLNIFEDERLIENLDPSFAAIQRGLDTLKKHPWVRDLRRNGVIAAFTLKSPLARAGAEADYLDDAGWRFSAEARKRGVFIRPLGNVVYYVLPLTTTVQQIEELFEISYQSIVAAFGDGV
jgi:adenosylmethionine---8-amino-7-oxononanoate aminotransferase